MERLNTAVFYSTPSVLCVLLLYVVLPERAFALAAAIGGRASVHVRRGLSGIISILDAVFVFSMLIGLSRHCQPRLRYNAIECQERTVYCAGFQTGVVLVLATLLYFDRATAAFFLKRTDTSLSWRCTRAAVLGIAYTTITHDFQSVMVLIVLALLMRYMKLSPDSTSTTRLAVARTLGVYIGVVSMEAFLRRDEVPLHADKAYSVALASTTIALFRCR